MRSIVLVLCILTTLAAAWPGQQAKTEEPIYRVGKDVKPPRPKYAPSPDFADDARRGKFDGKVGISGYIGTDGKFHDAKVSRSIGDSQIDAKCLDAMKSMEISPLHQRRHAGELRVVC